MDWTSEHVGGFGMAVGGRAAVLRPDRPAQVAEAIAAVRAQGGTLALRGAGRSYGDAATNTGGHVLDLTGLDRILSFDPERGLATVEPGVSIRDLWRRTIEYGFWPPVVPGTMHVSVGGAAAMNIHGKNHYAVGSFGEHVRSFVLQTAGGETLRCSREENAALFHNAIGGFGMLGCFTELTLKLERVASGRLRVWAIPARDLGHNLELIENLKGESDYLVSWLDLHGRGAGLGRGLLHRACQLQPGEDPRGIRWFDASMQDLPGRLFGLVPKGWLWPGMWLATHCGGVALVNRLKFRAGPREQRRSPYLQSHGAYHFLLDYVPRWHWMTRPGGLIQFQPFVPAPSCERVFRVLIERCHAMGLVPYLGVLKRHRPDPFPMTHSLDGFSLAMDFAVSARRRRREALWRLCRELADVVLEAGGRFYYAKDAVLESSCFERIHGAQAVTAFRELKRRCDPDGILQTDLSRRLGV